MGIAQIRFGFDLPWYSVMGMDKSLMGTRLLPGIMSNVGPKYPMMLHVRFLTFFVRFMPVTSCSPVIPVLSGGLQSHLTPSEGTVAASK